MHRLILQSLATAPDGLTTAQIERVIGIRGPGTLDAALRDLHWRGLVRRLRPSNGDVVYQIRTVAA